MSIQKKSPVFRVEGLSAAATDLHLHEQLEIAIKKIEAPGGNLPNFKVEIVPSCYENMRAEKDREKVALVQFDSPVPFAVDMPINMGYSTLSFDRQFLGITQLYTPTVGEIVADIVAIAGLDGHAYDTWVTEDDDRGSMWLRHYFVQHFPNCRTMTYGYDAMLQNHGIHTIADYGHGLLKELEKVRDTRTLRERPLIFIAHSFGGVILADALVSAAQQANSKIRPTIATLRNASFGVFMFGIPHRGLIVDDIRQMLASDNPRHRLLDDLEPSSVYLTQQRQKLVNYLDTQEIKIASYYEMLKTRRLAYDPESGKYKRTGTYAIAVDPDSALLQLSDAHEDKSYANADHSSMVKFKNMQEQTYKDVRYKLRSFLDHAPKVVKARFSQQQASTGMENQSLQQYPPFRGPIPFQYGTFSPDLGRYTGEDEREDDTQTIDDEAPLRIKDNLDTLPQRTGGFKEGLKRGYSDR